MIHTLVCSFAHSLAFCSFLFCRRDSSRRTVQNSQNKKEPQKVSLFGDGSLPIDRYVFSLSCIHFKTLESREPPGSCGCVGRSKFENLREDRFRRMQNAPSQLTAQKYMHFKMTPKYSHSYYRFVWKLYISNHLTQCSFLCKLLFFFYHFFHYVITSYLQLARLALADVLYFISCEIDEGNIFSFFPSVCILQCYMRALFDYEPEEDTLLPCKEIGLPFQYGDILQVS